MWPLGVCICVDREFFGVFSSSYNAIRPIRLRPYPYDLFNLNFGSSPNAVTLGLRASTYEFEGWWKHPVHNINNFCFLSSTGNKELGPCSYRATLEDVAVDLPRQYPFLHTYTKLDVITNLRVLPCLLRCPLQKSFVLLLPTIDLKATSVLPQECWADLQANGSPWVPWKSQTNRRESVARIFP